jgi:hypothetical protein
MVDKSEAWLMLCCAALIKAATPTDAINYADFILSAYAQRFNKIPPKKPDPKK